MHQFKTPTGNDAKFGFGSLIDLARFEPVVKDGGSRIGIVFRPLEAIEADIKTLEGEILALLGEVTA